MLLPSFKKKHNEHIHNVHLYAKTHYIEKLNTKKNQTCTHKSHPCIKLLAHIHNIKQVKS